jgi:hypothetical protein
MIPLDDWIMCEKEETVRSNDLIIPDTALGKTSVDVGDIFIAKKLGPSVGDRVKVGQRLLFYGIATVMMLKLPGGVTTWVGRAADVAFILEEGD